MIDFYLYDIYTGEITSNGFLPRESDLELQEQEGKKAEKGRPNPNEKYVDLNDLSVKDKQENPANLSGNTLSNLPLPCTVSIFGPSYKVIRAEEKSTLSLRSDIAGQHKVKVTPDNPKYYTANFKAYLEPKE